MFISQMKTCEVCGRSIITGRKYCFRHRSGRHQRARSTGEALALTLAFIGIIGFALIFMVIFIISYTLGIIYRFVSNRFYNKKFEIFKMSETDTKLQNLVKKIWTRNMQKFNR